MIYLCEAVAQGVRSFGSTLCTQTRHIRYVQNLLMVTILTLGQETLLTNIMLVRDLILGTRSLEASLM